MNEQVYFKLIVKNSNGGTLTKFRYSLEDVKKECEFMKTFGYSVIVQELKGVIS